MNSAEEKYYKINHELDNENNVINKKNFNTDKDKLLACLLSYIGDLGYRETIDSNFNYFVDFTNYVVENNSFYETGDKFLLDDTGKAILQILYQIAKEQEF